MSPNPSEDRTEVAFGSPIPAARAGLLIGLVVALGVGLLETYAFRVVRQMAPWRVVAFSAVVIAVAVALPRARSARTEGALLTLVSTAACAHTTFYAAQAVDGRAEHLLLIGLTAIAMVALALAPTARTLTTCLAPIPLVPILLVATGQVPPLLTAHGVTWLFTTVGLAAVLGRQQHLLRVSLGHALAAAEQLAERDILTGRRNRRWFLRTGHALLGGPHGPVALLCFDVDDFKRVNDTLGHDAGDEVLRTISTALASALRTGDELARIGGEEFAVLLPGVDAATASMVCERMRMAVVSHGSCDTTVSAGYAVARQGEGLEALLRRADRALYAAKSAGKNLVRAA